MRLPRFSLNRPVTVLMLVLAVLLFGFISLDRLGLELLPDLTFPVTAVITIYPNADPATIESQVTRPIEGAIRGTNNLRRTYSISQENLSIVVAEFGWGTNLGVVGDEIRQSLETLGRVLPQGVERPFLLRFDPSMLPLTVVGLVGEDLVELSQSTRDLIIPRLEQIPGVAQVGLYGDLSWEIEVLYDPHILASLGMEPSLLGQLMMAQNLTIPAGAVEVDGVRYQTRVGGGLTSLEELGDLVVGVSELKTPFGILPRPLPLSEVAQISQVSTGRQAMTRVNGSDALILQVTKQSGENTVIVANQVSKALAELEAEHQFQFLTVFDQSTLIQSAISGLGRSGLIGALLALAVLWAFLRHMKSALVVAISIPLSVVATFILMYFSGLTLNLMSLGGLALGIGMLVDNSIVVLENIFRHRQMGLSPQQAAAQGAGEVGLAITASTLTTLAVFLPVVFVKSLAGELFKELALTVAFSLAVSLLVSLTVVPLLASLVLGRVGRVQTHKWQSGYRQALNWGLDHQGLVLGSLALLTLISIGVGLGLHRDFMGSMDVGYFRVQVELPPGTPQSRTENLIKELEAIALGHEAVERVASVAGVGSGDMVGALNTSSPNSGYLIISTWQHLPAQSQKTMEALRQQMEAALVQYPGAQIRMVQEQGGLSFAGSALDIQVLGQDLDLLAQTSEQVLAALAQVPEFTDLQSSLEARQPLLYLQVQPVAALMQGLTAAQVGMGMRSALLGQEVTHLRLGGESIPVYLRPDLGGDRLDSLMAIPVSANFPLGGLIDLHEDLGPIQLQRDAGRRVIRISGASQLPASLIGSKARKAMADLEIPGGIEIRYGGLGELMAESLSDLSLALALAIALVYMVMAAQFESLKYPLTVIFSLPLAGIGVVWVHKLTGYPIGVPSLIGAIVLAGVIVNNAIVLVDTINRLVRQGAPVRQAILDGAQSRLRPVLMTALTTILGLIPLALGFGEAREMEVPLAMTVIAGMFVGTLLTLVIIPLLYSLFEGRFPGFAPREGLAKVGDEV